MPHEDLIDELKRRDAEALAMGGPEKLAQRKAQGLLNARERIDLAIEAITMTPARVARRAPSRRKAA